MRVICVHNQQITSPLNNRPRCYAKSAQDAFWPYQLHWGDIYFSCTEIFSSNVLPGKILAKFHSDVRSIVVKFSHVYFLSVIVAETLSSNFVAQNLARFC